MSAGALQLRETAGQLAGRLPPLLADARRLAATVRLGEHGRRQSGAGTEFWQFRTAMPGDAARQIDWRRSARSDSHFVREREWQAAQTATFWVDPGQSMQFTSRPKTIATKHDRAALLGLALAVLLNAAGERTALAGQPAGTGDGQLLRMALALSAGGEDDYAGVDLSGLPARSHAILLSDFLAPSELLVSQVTAAADRGIRGSMVQITDPSEETFPFSGRTLFQSIGGTISHEIQKAAALKTSYARRLAERRAVLSDLARTTGWQFLIHHSDEPAQAALLWLYGATGRPAS